MRRHGLAGAIAPLQQDAALQRDTVLQALVGVADRRPDGGGGLRPFIVIQDEGFGRDAVGLQESQIVEVHLAVIVALQADRLALVDRAGLQLFPRQCRQLGQEALLFLPHGAGHDETAFGRMEKEVGLDGFLDVRQGEGAVENLHLLVFLRPGLDGHQVGSHRPEESHLRNGLCPSIDFLHRRMEGDEGIMRMADDVLAHIEDGVLFFQLPLQHLDGVLGGHRLGFSRKRDLGADMLDVMVVFDRGHHQFFTRCHVFLPWQKFT